jgi:hypothetical protein
MVLGPQGPGRVSRRRVIKKRTTEMLFFFLLPVDAKLCFAHRHIKEAFPYGNP